jgi:hypothetical protein
MQNLEQTIYRACKATFMKPDQLEETYPYVQRPFSFGPRPTVPVTTSSKSDKSCHMDDELQELVSFDNDVPAVPPEMVSSDDDIQEPELDYPNGTNQLNTAENGRAPTFADIENFGTRVFSRVENYLLKPDSQETLGVQPELRSSTPDSGGSQEVEYCLPPH